VVRLAQGDAALNTSLFLLCCYEQRTLAVWALAYTRYVCGQMRQAA
jgi:hypothetical protein